ncbi:MAG TPA: hypothetical protein VK272_14200 [Solirubrobacteraceae bacterium]|nr:hypothetical protein [Solirubrobacteraceae bacterium]
MTPSAAVLSEPPILCDHLNLVRWLGGIVPFTQEPGWLVLTATGEVLFFYTAKLTPDAEPKFRASDPLTLRPKATRRGIEATFGGKRYFLAFTGFTKPAGSNVGAVAESAGTALNIIGTIAGPLLQAGGLVGRGKELLDNRGYKDRARAAQASWLSVLTGEKDWRELARQRSASA